MGDRDPLSGSPRLDLEPGNDSSLESDNYRLLWLLNSLWQPVNQANVSLQIPMLDTIVYFNDGSQRWYFTSKNGLLMKKHERRLNWPEVRKAFLRAHKKLCGPEWPPAASSKPYIALSRRLPNGYFPLKSRLLDEDQLEAMFCHKEHHRDLIALQVYARPRGCGGGGGGGVLLGVYEATGEGRDVHLETYELAEGPLVPAAAAAAAGADAGRSPSAPGSPDATARACWAREGAWARGGQGGDGGAPPPPPAALAVRGPWAGSSPGGGSPELPGSPGSPGGATVAEEESEVVPGTPPDRRRSWVEAGAEARRLRAAAAGLRNHPVVPDSALRLHGSAHRAVSGYLRRLVRHVEAQTGRELGLLLAEFVRTAAGGVAFAFAHRVQVLPPRPPVSGGRGGAAAAAAAPPLGGSLAADSVLAADPEAVEETFENFQRRAEAAAGARAAAEGGGGGGGAEAGGWRPSFMRPTESAVLASAGARGAYGAAGAAGNANLRRLRVEQAAAEAELQREMDALRGRGGGGGGGGGGPSAHGHAPPAPPPGRRPSGEEDRDLDFSMAGEGGGGGGGGGPARTPSPPGGAGHRRRRPPSQAELLRSGFGGRAASGRVSGHDLKSAAARGGGGQEATGAPAGGAGRRPASAPAHRRGGAPPAPHLRRLPRGAAGRAGGAPQSARAALGRSPGPSAPGSPLASPPGSPGGAGAGAGAGAALAFQPPPAESLYRDPRGGGGGGGGRRRRPRPPPAAVRAGGQPGGAGGPIGCHGDLCDIFFTPGASAWPAATAACRVAFKSVLLARAEDRFLGTTLQEALATVPRLEELDVASVLGQLARLRLQLVMDKCREMAIRVWQNDNAPGGTRQLALAEVEDGQRQLLYGAALGHLHPARFYQARPVCRNCLQAYRVVDRERQNFPLLLNVAAAKVPRHSHGRGGGRSAAAAAAAAAAEGGLGAGALGPGGGGAQLSEWDFRPRAEGAAAAAAADLAGRRPPSAVQARADPGRMVSETAAAAARREAIAAQREEDDALRRASLRRRPRSAAAAAAAARRRRPVTASPRVRRALSQPQPQQHPDGNADDIFGSTSNNNQKHTLEGPRRKSSPHIRAQQRETADRLSKGLLMSKRDLAYSGTEPGALAGKGQKNHGFGGRKQNSAPTLEDFFEEGLEEEFNSKPPMLPLHTQRSKHSSVNKRSLFPLLPRGSIEGTDYVGV